MKPLHQASKPLELLSSTQLQAEIEKLMGEPTAESQKLITISVSLITELFKHFNQRHEVILKELSQIIVEKMDDHIREVIQDEVTQSLQLLTGSRAD